MSSTYPNHRRLKKALLLLAASLLVGQSFGLTFSGESNVFDLTPSPVNTYFSAESNIFSLQGQESEYTFNVSPAYSTAQQLFRVTAYVYDRGSGAVVSSGAGTYRVTQGGQTLKSGSLSYVTASRLWDGGSVALTAAGTLSVQVTVNGWTATTSLVIPSSNPVQLVGYAKRDNGTGISGGTVRLYNASTVFAATDLNNLPAPLASRTTPSTGSFDFSTWPVGQYVLTLQTGNGLTIGAAFWLRSGETTHSETIIENPGRTDLLNRFLALRESIRLRVLDRQTDWMVEVAHKVDGDIDATPSDEDWFWFLGNILSANAAQLGQAWAAQLSATHFGTIMSQTTVPILQDKARDVGITVGASIFAEEASSIYNQTLAAKGALTQPYFAYGEAATAEIADFDSLFTEDVKRLIDPNRTAPFLDVVFSRNDPIHRHPKSWFQALDTYCFAERWLTNYHQAASSALPTLHAQFSATRARRILEAADDQLRALEAGTGQLFVGPNPTEVSSSSASFEPLPLNLADYYSKYKLAQSKIGVLDWVKRGSSTVAIGSHLVAGASALGVVTAPGAAVAETVAQAAGAVSFGASIIKAPIKADMAGTYIQMGTKYCANIVSAPLALKRTTDFIISEAASPYYLNSVNAFDGQVNSISLGGALIGGREVFFPIQLSLLPFCPPIRLTAEKEATVQFQNVVGKNTAVFRVETKVRDFSGVHDHTVSPGGQLNGGQGATVKTPFHGHLMANGLLSAGTFETRLWTGPFQATRATTRDFFVMPINIGLPSSPLSAQQDAETKAAMRSPLGFVKSENQPLSGEDMLVIADRVRERVESNLVVGASSFSRQYAFPTNIFGAEFRLYRPVGASVAFRVEKDGEYIGWDEGAGIVHQGFPGDYSGSDANPEIIIVPNIDGQTVTVHVALGAVETDTVNVLLEVWEQPVRNAVLAVLPDSVNSISRTGITHVVEVAIGESSHQHPLEAVTFSASSLVSATGMVLNWSAVSWEGTTNIPAAGLKTCSLELNTQGVPDGTYTGTVVVASTNAGTVTVPVSITIDGQAPVVTIQPIREWWFNPTGPVVTWTGQDNVTAQSNLLYTYILEPLDGSWSGYLQTTNRDLSGIADGSYLLSVLGRDQALNESPDQGGTVIRIDRSGNLWKQRIVDANPSDAITNTSQVAWNDDFDGDGANNLMEYYAGTDPTNPGDLFAFAAANTSPTGLVIQWKAKRGFTYQVRRTTNLVNGSWEDAPTSAGADEKGLLTAPADGLQTYRDATVTGGPVFYKVETRN